MNEIIDYFVPAQDPILGINPANVVTTLDADNWQSKALTFQISWSQLYVYLSKATNTRRRKHYYCVSVYDIGKQESQSRRLFLTLNEALEYANAGAASLQTLAAFEEAS
ncbi:hypothetical protein [Amphritea balenae]|uniref:Uncharacterized protein n=1 Tax=Amphritea balenae TaxID=452629 RepID=A0A3P1SWW9_9GAMM|nr:hypothetical protein [Amphritea balenae]RRD01548.1 hypothetical protein EHS89_03045 [Amphritea balenae]GGK56050.1 hypothetical protein GCM10007941_02830 [Amphritea balenae]